MPAIVACPKCQSRYQLPDNVVGKQIQCKKCGHKFAATPVAPPQAQGAAKVAVATTGEAKPSAAKTPLATSAVVARPARTIPSASAADLAKFGLDGPIQRQAEVLSELPSPPPREILGNLAADPGFASESVSTVNITQNASSVDDGLSSIVNNPYARQEIDFSAHLNSAEFRFKSLKWPVNLLRFAMWGVVGGIVGIMILLGLGIAMAIAEIQYFVSVSIILMIFTAVFCGVCALIFAVSIGVCTYVSAHNLRSLGVESLKYSPGLLTASWYIPFLNLVYPYLGLIEISKASKKPYSKKWESQKKSGKITALIVCAIITGVISIIFSIQKSMIASRMDDFRVSAARDSVGVSNDEERRVSEIPDVTGFSKGFTIFVQICGGLQLILGIAIPVMLVGIFETIKEDQNRARRNAPKIRP